MLTPIQQLREGILRIGRGELDHRIHVAAGGELGALAEQFNATVASLQESFADLESKLASRTLERDEALAQQRATADVLKIISRSAFDLQFALDTLLESAAQLCEAQRGFMFKRDGDVFRIAANYGYSQEFVEFRTQNPIVLGRGTLTGRAALEGKVVHIRDAQVDPEFTLVHGDLSPKNATKSLALGGYRTMLGVPMLRDGVVMGVITLSRTEVRPFSEKQIELVATFADQAVIAFENVRLFEEVQARTRELGEALEQQTATSQVLQSISRSTFDLETILETLAQSAARLCEADIGSITRHKDGVFYRAAMHGFPPEFVHKAKTLPVEIDRGTITGRTLMEGKSVRIDDVAQDPEYTWSEAQEAGGFRTLLGVPLLRGGTPIGAIALGRRDVQPFSDKHVELVATFADQAVIAIENVRLFEEAQARTAELSIALEQQTATSQVLQSISRSTFDLEVVLQTLVQSAARLCEADICTITRQKDGVFYSAVMHGFPPEFELKAKTRPVEINRGTMFGRTLMSRTVVHIDDVLADPDYTWSEAQEAGGFRTLLGVPLLGEGTPIGAIALGRRSVLPFTDKQIELVTTFADQAVIAIENVRLFEEVQARTRELGEALEYQTAIADVLNVISRSPSELQPVLDTIVQTAGRLCRSEFTFVFRLHDDGHYHIAASDRGEPRFVEFLERHPTRPGDGSLTGRVALERRTIHVRDATRDPTYHWPELLELTGFHTLLSVPLMREGQVTGVIALARTAVDPFSDKQIELVTTFADQAVIAIENVRLFEEVEARTRELTQTLEHQTATADVLNVISRSPSEIQPVLDTIVETAGRLCGAEYAFIARFAGGKGHFVASNQLESEHAQYLLQHPVAIDRSSVTGRVALERTTVHVPDVLADPEFTHLEWQKVGRQRTVLGVPLLREGALVGAILLARTTVEPFTGKQIDLVTTFADQAVIAIENARLFEQVQERTRELSRSVEELRALGEVSQAVNSTLDLEKVLDTIVARAVQLSATDAGTIYVFSNLRQKFRLRATFGMTQDLIEAIGQQAIRIGETVVGVAAQRREPVEIPDLLEEPRHPVQDIILHAGFRALLVVPLLRADRIVGALVVRRKEPGRFPQPTIDLLQTFAAQSVLAIQNARMFSEIEQKSHELEIASRHKSQFLANMSHELRTPMNAVLGFTELMADGLYGALPEKAVRALERVQANGKHLLGLINDVLDLSKIEAGQLTLSLEGYSVGQIVQTARSAMEPLAKAKGLALTATVQEGLPIGHGDERRLTQVLLNLVGNAVKFTDAGTIDVGAGMANGFFEISVRDTGPGIAPADQARIFEEFQQVDSSTTRKKGGTGLGLAISKRLIEMHGGTLRVDSAVGEGSTFRITIPVRAIERAEAA